MKSDGVQDIFIWLKKMQRRKGKSTDSGKRV